MCVQYETELSFRLIPSFAEITSSLNCLVRGFVHVRSGQGGCEPER